MGVGETMTEQSPLVRNSPEHLQLHDYSEFLIKLGMPIFRRTAEVRFFLRQNIDS